jgi:two-component system chemotaxis response regulator CheY
MDEIDGLQLVSAVRSDKTIPSIAILLVTASMSQRHVGRARAVRADGYLIKPFTAESLRRKLVEIVAIRPPEVEADDPSAPKGHNAKVTRWSKSQDDSD